MRSCSKIRLAAYTPIIEECVYLPSNFKLLAILGIPFFCHRLIKLRLWSESLLCMSECLTFSFKMTG